MTDPSPAFTLQSSAVGDDLVVAVTGEIDMTTAPELAKAIEVISNHTRNVIVDLGGVTFLDSSGLNALIRGQRGLSKRQVGLRVVAPADGIVRRVFEITQLTEALSVVESLDDALR
jgi:anti-sigma B factor antagonist